MNDTELMQIAIDEALKGLELGDQPFGAVLAKDGEVICTGRNLEYSTFDPTAHAEIIAIRNGCEKLDSFQLDDCEIYCSCEPCPMCLSACYWSRIDKIYYANTREDAKKIDFDDSLIYEQLTKSIKERKIRMTQLMRNEALKAFELWDKKTDKVKY